MNCKTGVNFNGMDQAWHDMGYRVQYVQCCKGLKVDKNGHEES